MAEEFTTETFTQKVTKNDGYAVVDFYAPWCGPCQSFAPTFNEVGTEMADKATFGKVNVDEAGEIAQELGIMSIPTLIVFKGGKEVTRITGAMSKSDFVSMLEENLK